MKRKIIHIDEDKCDGCGVCVKACHEGAIRLVDGKARLVSETYCDGLGACIGECPRGAITITEREAPAFDPSAVAAAKTQQRPEKKACGCPGSMAMAFHSAAADSGTNSDPVSQLQQWPVQLHLVPVRAPYWENADLLIAADCTAVAYGAFQNRLLQGKKVIIACPKLDETTNYVDKLADIFIINSIQSVTVAFMEVPCCSGLVRIVREALAKSGREIPLHLVRVGIRGGAAEVQ